MCAESGEGSSGASRRWAEVYWDNDQIFFEYHWAATDQALCKGGKTSKEKDWAVYFCWRQVTLAAVPFAPAIQLFVCWMTDAS